MTRIADFTCAGYRSLIVALLDRGYRVCGYDEADPAQQHLILRHDIDFSPSAACAMAEIEHELDVTATYFFMLECPFYKAAEPETREAFSRIIELGHSIGLHFDAAARSQELPGLEDEIAAECGRLEALSGRRVDIVSFHRPSTALLNHAAPVAGRLHTYQPRFFGDIGYCSDSRGRWRHGHPLEHPAVEARKALQLLTHPIWWVHDDAGDRERTLSRVIESHGSAIIPAISETVTGYDPASGRIIE